jgi:hypothetical protein
VSAPRTGDRVRLVALRGASSPAMREQVGRTGTVIGVRRQQGGSDLVQARFPTAIGVDDVFWLKPGEWESVEPAPSTAGSPPENHTTQSKECPVADFATAVQHRLDHLAEADQALGQQIADLARQRDDLGRERRALEAARSAYEKVRRGAVGVIHAVPRPRSREGAAEVRRFLGEWASAHGGVVETAAIAAEARRRGLSEGAIRSQLERTHERVGRGTYRPRAGSVA